MGKEHVAASVDLGTSKVATFVGRTAGQGVEILGYGVVESAGVRTGAVNNVPLAAEAVRASIQEAESSSGVRVRDVVVGLACSEVVARSMAADAVLGETSREIGPHDVERLREKLRAQVPQGGVLLHVEPQEFLVDGETLTSDPVAMWGNRLQVRALVVTALESTVRNLKRTVQLAGARVADVVLEPLASAAAVFQPDERLLGVALVDLGGGTSDVAVFQRGAIRLSAVIPMGGEMVTRDLASVLRTRLSVAEQLKRTVGILGPDEEAGNLEVPSLGDEAPRSIPASLVSEVIRARVEEVLEQVSSLIEAKVFPEPLAGGVVLTGGASRLAGLPRLAQKVLRLPVRCAGPRAVEGAPELARSPEHSTGVGLLVRALTNRPGGDRGPQRPWTWIARWWKQLG